VERIISLFRGRFYLIPILTFRYVTSSYVTINNEDNAVTGIHQATDFSKK